MPIKRNRCGRAMCQFPVDEGMQCDNCKRWFHSMCTNLTPAAYKRCCKPLANWLCNDCCSTTKLRITEAIATLSGALKLMDCKRPPPQKNTDYCSDSDDVASVIDKTAHVPDATLPISECSTAQKNTHHITDTQVAPTILDEPSSDGNGKTAVKKRRTRGRKPAAPVAQGLAEQASSTPVSSRQTNPTKISEEDANEWRTVVSRKKRDKDNTSATPPKKDRNTLTPQGKKVTESKPDLSDRSLILHKVEESLALDPKTRFEHDLNLVKPLLDKLLPQTVSGITIHSVYRIGQKPDPTVSEPVRLLKVVLNSKAERDAILSNSHILKGSGIYVRADLSLADRVKRQAAALELSERRRNGEKNLKIKGFRVVRVRSLMIPKPLWVGRGSTNLN
uniref:PHD-type domain-containing protein n=1 Tax=Trichobilharzia regenti TaxID=157069 RepID=A0AA85K348_TRIRE|nr:unnamed protein product [Trichobilharzia regenti]